MSNLSKTPPEGFHTITPYLFVKSAASAIEFYKKAFNATEKLRLASADGKIMYAELSIGNSAFMLADEFPEMNVLSPQSLGGSAVTIHLYVDNVDALVNQAVAAGAKILRPIQDQFFGDRAGSVTDPFGHTWHMATRKEEVSREEILKRFNTMMRQ